MPGRSWPPRVAQPIRSFCGPLKITQCPPYSTSVWIGSSSAWILKMIACTMSMDAMGVSKDELLDDLTYGGVATYMADAVRSRVTLFI